MCIRDRTRAVPLHWIWLGVILTLLESWNAKWSWVAPNILFSFALIRSARPYVQILLQRHGWAAFAFLVSAILAVFWIAAKIVDYGSEGWLWALFGLCQRMYVDGGSATDVDGSAQSSAPVSYTHLNRKCGDCSDPRGTQSGSVQHRGQEVRCV